MRERSPNGDTVCKNGHRHKHSLFTKAPKGAVVGWYRPGEVPLHGASSIYHQYCRCKDDADQTKDCGCGFGQCKMGLIF